MSNQNYYDRTLISLRRQYSKDEVVAAISKKLNQISIKLAIYTENIWEELKQKMREGEESIISDPEVYK